MLSNIHTQTTFCDGKNTPEEIVLYAINNGFSSIGFSGHGYTPFDLRYCMQNTEGYIEEITKLKSKYKDKIQIYCGIEEDAFSPVDRKNFDYIIGSSHYFCVKNKYYPIDSDYNYFKKCLEIFDYNITELAHTYYQTFCDYIKKRKPDVVGHFDVITKFDKIDVERFLCNKSYLKISEKYISDAVKNDVIFEVNTGAISRGFRKTPYPYTNLLHILKKHGGKLLLASDSHSIETLDYYFKETKEILRDIGFDYVYILHDNSFIKNQI